MGYVILITSKQLLSKVGWEMNRMQRLQQTGFCKKKDAWGRAGTGILLAVFLSVLNIQTVRAEETVFELDLRKGDILISEGGYFQAGTGVSGYEEPPKYIITSGGEKTENRIIVSGGEQNITLQDVHIERTDAGATATGAALLLERTEGNTSDGQPFISAVPEVNLTLEGKNTLNGPMGVLLGFSGNEKQQASLTITGESTGEVEIISNSGYAGIYTHKNPVEIHGGTVIVRGGDGAAGIGGGYNDDCGDVTITGGHVEVYGGKANQDRGIGAGCGIGNSFRETSGALGEIGEITVSGGTLIADGGGEGSTGIGGAQGTAEGKRGVFTLEGDAWVDASGLNVETADRSSGVLFEGEDEIDDGNNFIPAGKVYGQSYTLIEDAGIRAGKTLQIDRTQVLRVRKGQVLTIEENGTLRNEGIVRIRGEGCINGGGLATGTGKFYLFTDEFEITDEWHADGTDLTDTVRSRLTEIFEAACTKTICREGNFKPESDWSLTLNPRTVRSAGEYQARFAAASDEVRKTFKVLTGNMVTKIEITALPAKTDYEIGDGFDPSGMKVTATFQDGTTKDVTEEIKIEDGRRLKPGQTTVTITYQDSHDVTVETTVSVSVNKKAVDISEIELDDLESNLVYTGEEQTITFTGKMPEYVDMKIVGGNTGTDAGNYTAQVEFTIKEGYEDRYTFGDGAGTSIIVDKSWTIDKKKLDWDTGALDAVGNTRDDNAYIYGEIGVEGIVPIDKEEGAIPETFPTDKITGTHEKLPGEKVEIKLDWKDENDKLELGNDGAAGNYELDELPVIKNGIVNEVNEIPLPPELNPVEGTEFRMDIETRISRVPDALLPQYMNPEELEGWMVKELVDNKGVSQSYVSTYDLTLMSREEGESEWQRVGSEQVPEGGLTITLPYPEGITKEDYDGIVSYVYPEDMNEIEAGTQVYLEVIKTEEGIQFIVPGAGPIAVGWKNVADGSGDGAGDGDGSGDDTGDGDGSGDGAGDGDGSGDSSGTGGGSSTGTGNGSSTGSGSGTGSGNGTGSGSGTGTSNAAGSKSSTGTGSGAGIFTGDQARIAVYIALGILSLAIIFVTVQIYNLDKKKVKKK